MCEYRKRNTAFQTSENSFNFKKMIFDLGFGVAKIIFLKRGIGVLDVARFLSRFTCPSPPKSQRENLRAHALALRLNFPYFAKVRAEIWEKMETQPYGIAAKLF